MNTKSSSVAYRGASVSDVHLGHRSTLTAFILQNLRQVINRQLFEELDFFVIAGDLYDRILDQSQEEARDIDDWILELLHLAKDYNVILYVLEGTPLHDREQSKRIATMNASSKILAEVHYFNTITVHYEPRLQRHFLFVPDEATTTVEETLLEVKRCIAEKGISQVDSAFMHGAFYYQLPEIAGGHKHEEAAYLALTKHLISIGHVHETSSFEHIYAQGSFDRLNHGTEIKKGFIRFVVYQDDTHEVTFVENTNAKRYDTYVLEEDDVEATLLALDRLTATLPDDSHVRIRVNETHPMLKTPEVLIRRYPHLNWKIEPKKKKAKKEMTNVKARFTPIPIHAGNIQQLILAALATRSDMTPEYLAIAEQQLHTEG